MNLARSTVACAILFSLSVLPTRAQNTSVNPEALLRKMQPWHTQCFDKGCIISVDVLRSALHGGTPDPKDANQYISVSLAEDRSPLTVNFLMFEVDPHANPNRGLEVELFRTEPDGKSFKSIQDPKGPLHLDFTRCKEQASCMAYMKHGQTKDGLDMLSLLQHNDHLLIGYYVGDQFFDVAINLPFFLEAYQHLLDVDIKQPVPAGQPK